MRLDPGLLLYLQGTIGNAAVAGLVQRRQTAGICAGPGQCDCADCTEDKVPVSRQPQPAAPAGTAPAPGVVPDHYRVQHKRSRQFFNADAGQVRKTLELFVFERNSSDALKLFDSDADFVGPVPVPSLPGQPCDLDPQTCSLHRQKVVRVVKQEVQRLKSHMTGFKQEFERRANGTLHMVLADSEDKINQEKARYGLEKKEGIFSWLTGADYSMSNPQDLTNAAKALLEKFHAIRTATHALAKCTELGGALPPGGTEAICAPEEQARAEAEVRKQEKEYSVLRHQLEGEHPVLISYELDPGNASTHGTLATLATGTGDTKAELLYRQIEEKLTNIQTTREHALAHHDMVWRLSNIVGITQKLPDIAGYEKLPSALHKLVIEEAQRQVVVDAAIQYAAMAAIALGLGMLVAPLSAAGLGELALAAETTQVGIEAAMVIKAIRQYQFEKAATNTDLDAKAKSISQEEPSLFWLAVEIVTIIPLTRAAAEFRALVGLYRHATAAKLAKNDAEAAKLLDEMQRSCKRLDLPPGVGARLQRQVDQLGTSAGQDANEIAANLANVVRTKFPGCTHEIAMGGGKFWRRTADGRWCFFASPPRCPVGLTDVQLAPTLAGISLDTRAVLMSYPHVLRRAIADPRVGEMLAKYGVDAVKAMHHAPFHGFDGLDVLQRFARLHGKVKGVEQLLKDLAAGSSTTKGAIGELYYIQMLLNDGFKVERVADWINGKKAADIVLEYGTVIDMKWYDWSQPLWKDPTKVKAKATEMVRQVVLRKQQYPGAPIMYVFAGSKGEIPASLVRALKDAGVDVVRGTVK